MERADSICIDIYENRVKQSYRNRCEILGANGPLNLIIPIKHEGHRTMKDIKICYDNSWQKIHWKSLQSAYQRSPYFEYYEHKIAPLFEKQPPFLINWNASLLSFCMEVLQRDYPIVSSTSYIPPESSMDDYRDDFSPKKAKQNVYTPYSQVFEDRFSFQENLSIFDLICNKGPETQTYIKQNSLTSI